MKKYTAPSLKAIKFSGEDIIQTSGGGVTTANVPTTVVKGANGTQVTATGYGATNFNSAYGTTMSIAD